MGKGKLIPNAFNWGVVSFVALGSTACTYGMAVIGSTIGQPTFYRDMGLATEGEPGYSRTSSLLGAMNGLHAAGSAIGAGLAAWSADRLGRKHSIQLGAVILTTGAALCAGSVGVAMFLVARFIAGLGIGVMYTVIPMYQAECSAPESRGFMVSMHGVLIAVGYNLSAWISFGLYFMSAGGSQSSFPWRFPMAFQCAPALLMLAGSPWLPKSPRWLLQKGRTEEAFEVIKNLHRIKGDTRDLLAKREFYQMRKQLELDHETHQTLGRFPIFATAPNRKRALLGFMITFGTQFTGTLIIVNYGVLLYTALGMKTFMPLLLTSIYLLVSLPCNIFTSLSVDKFGRRTFLLIGCVGCLVCLTFEAALQARYLGTTNSAGQKAAIFFIFLFIFFYAGFLDCTQYVYLAEIFPTHIRSQGMAVGLIGYYIADIIILCAGPTALANIQWKFFLVFIIPLALFTVMVYFMYPETMQRSLEDINAEFGEKVAVHYYHATKEEEMQYAQIEGAKDIDEILEAESHMASKTIPTEDEVVVLEEKLAAAP